MTPPVETPELVERLRKRIRAVKLEDPEVRYIHVLGDDLEALIAAIASLSDQTSGLREALADAREAIASLPEFALGGEMLTDTHTGECTGQYGIRDELLAKIDAAIVPRSV